MSEKLQASKLADLAVIVRVAKDDTSAALTQAMVLAERHGAHLAVTLAAQELIPPYSPVWDSMAAGFVSELNQQTKAAAEAMAETLKRQSSMPGLTLTTRVVATAIASAAANAVVAARACDMIIVDQPMAPMDTRGIILEEALFRSGRPVLVATPHKAPQAQFKRAVIAWDGSSHAARAAGDALALLPGLEIIDLVSVAGEKSLGKGLPGADAAQHFARKGFEVTLSDVPIAHGSVGLTVNEHALATGADIIVMGGFGHSRFREFLLGGATVKLTQEASLPLLMAH